MKNTFSLHFIKQQKKSIEFIDIHLDKDLKAFICPFLIENNKLSNPIALSVYENVHQFLTKLNRDFIKPNKITDGLSFLSHLHEPNEYHLGYSSINKGRAVSKTRAESIYNALRNNTLTRKNLEITNEAHFVLLLVKGIGQDIISDIIANVCREIFADFTTKICEDYGIGTHATNIEFYNASSEKWEIKSVNLPYYNGKHIVLLPKFIISGAREYSSSYNWFIAKHHLATEILNRKEALPTDARFITNMKDGTKKAIITEIYKVYRKPKDELIEFVIKFQGSLDEFVWYAKEHYPELDLNNIN